MAINARFGGKALTAELRKLAGEVYEIDPTGEPITREQALAALIWRQALGWVEEKRDDNGNLQKIDHPPVAWAQQYLFERMEGKAPISVPEDNGGIRAAQKVSDLATQRLNGITAKVIPTPPVPTRKI